ncbi:hypothetical protein L3V16_15550 [Brucella ciceri]|uniref:hypothetical protein n=1 Tax=Brucella ciceri TaxID=391287 RepID=UPI001F129160|nr:hypothetical protein [Brucella ciceri]MCH6205251.1 hypothetical protein [Brucella ciceri]
MSGNTVTVIAAVVAAVGTLATATATSISAYQIAEIQRQTSDRQSDIEMVKLALNILGGEISDKTKESRIFAVEVLKKFSNVSIDDGVASDWAASGTVSFSSKSLGLAPGGRTLQDLFGMPNPGYRPNEAPAIMKND